METEHLCEELQQESVELVPGARVYERGNVTVSYLDSYTFLICISCSCLFSLELTSYMEDHYTFTLGPHSFSLPEWGRASLIDHYYVHCLLA